MIVTTETATAPTAATTTESDDELAWRVLRNALSIASSVSEGELWDAIDALVDAERSLESLGLDAAGCSTSEAISMTRWRSSARSKTRSTISSFANNPTRQKPTPTTPPS